MSCYDYLDRLLKEQLASLGPQKKIFEYKLEEALQKRLSVFKNPNTDRFFDAYSKLPSISYISSNLLHDVSISSDKQIDKSTLSLIYNSLMSLSPWRKGPFSLFDITINAEWKSNLKWDRLKPVFPLLKNKRIIDIGCGNGYYMYRMLAHDPSFVMGVDPSDLTFFQFYAIQKYLEDKRLSYLPIGWQSLGCFDAYFDVVFCMGVLYHCKSPADLISMCRSVCKRDGVLVFETLIIDGDDDMALCPKDRYAKMPNVHFIPTVPCLLNWLKSGGFSSAEVISNEWTSTNEQRITEWTFPHSLSNCLDSENSRLTVEGYPAPKRVVVLATLK